jgi:hypothetical protein
MAILNTPLRYSSASIILFRHHPGNKGQFIPEEKLARPVKSRDV